MGIENVPAMSIQRRSKAIPDELFTILDTVGISAKRLVVDVQQQTNSSPANHRVKVNMCWFTQEASLQEHKRRDQRDFMRQLTVSSYPSSTSTGFPYLFFTQS
jgi:hypothetical protein